jgi:hypothetical protein
MPSIDLTQRPVTPQNEAFVISDARYLEIPMTVQLDKLDYAKKLGTTGAPVVQVKALAEVRERFVTFASDLFTFERSVEANIDALEARLTNKIEKFGMMVDQQITPLEWISGMAVALGIGILAKLLMIS